ncbi:MAG TPA: hypothetical protein VFD89_01590 [Clostridia bacterium]|nr:hypothetical protein [Clostridia bacterium]
MKDTVIVFVGIGVLILLPLIFFGVRSIAKSGKEKDYRRLLLRLLGTVLACAVAVVLLFNIYSFTLGYQLPLVAEGFLKKEGYAQLKEQGWDMDKFLVYFSENIYENDDGTKTIYVQFQGEEDSNYSFMNMKMVGNRWQVLSHNIITGDYDDYPEISKRFYLIDGKLPK